MNLELGTRRNYSRLERLTAFACVLGKRDASFGEWAPSQGKGTIEEPVHLAHFQYSELGQSFLKMLYDAGWMISNFSWTEWAHGPEAQGLIHHRNAIATADEHQLAKMLTSLARQDRFVEGTLADAFRAGLLLAIAERAEELCASPTASGDPPVS